MVKFPRADDHYVLICLVSGVGSEVPGYIIWVAEVKEYYPSRFEEAKRLFGHPDVFFFIWTVAKWVCHKDDVTEGLVLQSCLACIAAQEVDVVSLFLGPGLAPSN